MSSSAFFRAVTRPMKESYRANCLRKARHSKTKVYGWACLRGPGACFGKCHGSVKSIGNSAADHRIDLIRLAQPTEELSCKLTPFVRVGRCLPAEEAIYD